MKKNVYRLDNIDCAACALKIEDGVNKLDGVSSSSLNFMLLKFTVIFDETIINDEEIETCVHKSLNGVKILEKNNQEFIDTYETPKMLKRSFFKGRKR